MSTHSLPQVGGKVSVSGSCLDLGGSLFQLHPGTVPDEEICSEEITPVQSSDAKILKAKGMTR
jgi:hypothetical protein